MLLEHHGRVHCADEGRVAGREVDLERGQAGLLEVELRLLGVVGAWLHLVVEIHVGRRDGAVVARTAVAAQDGLHHRVAVQRELQGQAHVLAVEGRHVREHGNGVVLRARGLFDHHVLVALQERHGLDVGACDGIHLARDDGIHACGDVGDVDQLHLVEPGTSALPVAGVALEHHLHAAFVRDHGVAARADGRLPVHLAVLGRADHQVVVGDRGREVRAPGGQREDHAVLAIGLDVGDATHDALGGRLGLRATVVVEGGHHVVGVQCLAIAEGHATAQLEGPGLRVLGGFHALGEFGRDLVVGADLHQVVVGGTPQPEVGDGGGAPGSGVVRVTGVGARHTQAETPAALGWCGLCQGVGREAHADGGGGAGQQDVAAARVGDDGRHGVALLRVSGRTGIRCGGGGDGGGGGLGAPRQQAVQPVGVHLGQAGQQQLGVGVVRR